MDWVSLASDSLSSCSLWKHNQHRHIADLEHTKSNQVAGTRISAQTNNQIKSRPLHWSLRRPRHHTSTLLSIQVRADLVRCKSWCCICFSPVMRQIHRFKHLSLSVKRSLRGVLTLTVRVAGVEVQSKLMRYLGKGISQSGNADVDTDCPALWGPYLPVRRNLSSKAECRKQLVPGEKGQQQEVRKSNTLITHYSILWPKSSWSQGSILATRHGYAIQLLMASHLFPKGFEA